MKLLSHFQQSHQGVPLSPPLWELYFMLCISNPGVTSISGSRRNLWVLTKKARIFACCDRVSWSGKDIYHRFSMANTSTGTSALICYALMFPFGFCDWVFGCFIFTNRVPPGEIFRSAGKRHKIAVFMVSQKIRPGHRILECVLFKRGRNC